jgi:hypothetical protein
MSRNYKFRNPEGAYFVSFAVLLWSCIDHAKELPTVRKVREAAWDNLFHKQHI